MNIKDIPCNDCLTFAVCKARILTGEDEKSQYRSVLHHIFVICSLLHDYILPKIENKKKPNKTQAYRKALHVLSYFRGEFHSASKYRKLHELVKLYEKLSSMRIKK